MGFLNKILRRKPTSRFTAFSDYFDKGILSSDWIVSSWNAPGGGTFKSDLVTLDFGMLCLKMVQTKVDETIISIGSEIQLNKLCGYGSYEWEVRASSTAITPSSLGQFCSGSVTGLFNYMNNSETELDLEIEGCRPNILHGTTWKTVSNNQTNPMKNNENLDTKFHKYRYDWKPGQVDYFFDDVLFATHTNNVPSTPAYPMINHWGTNNPNWGGEATPDGVLRYMWVKRFSYTPF